MSSFVLRLWHDDDLPLLHRANTPEMTAHLNGPETDDLLLDRHARYLRLIATGEARMFVIESGGRPLGSIGHWKTRWRDEDALETGWFVLPEAQGHGVAGRALGLLIEDARGHAGGRKHLVAFPQTTNPPSNALCRSAGFRLAGTTTATFRGADLTMNEWVLGLDNHPRHNG
jgi:RimJ/RimL family protein N-acetyltransferase